MSMDGYNVNLKLDESITEDAMTLKIIQLLLDVGSCSLQWCMVLPKWCTETKLSNDRVWKSLHNRFDDVPAKREDLHQSPRITTFP